MLAGHGSGGSLNCRTWIFVLVEVGPNTTQYTPSISSMHDAYCPYILHL